MTRKVLLALTTVVCLLFSACVSRPATTPTQGTTETPSSSANETTKPAPTLSWPEPGSGESGVEPAQVAPPGAKPPAFPETVTDYAFVREWRTTVRVFSHDTEWAVLYECTPGGQEPGGCEPFPATMNGCGQQRFYVRWRSENPDVTVQATMVATPETDIVLIEPVSGVVGWMSGYGCGQPAFLWGAVAGDNQSTLADVIVEIQQWEVSV